MFNQAQHSGHGGINPFPEKHYPLFLAKPPLNQQTVQAPLFGQSPYILVFQEPLPPPLKSRVFQ